MWGFILYVLIVIIGIAVVRRLYVAGIIESTDYYDFDELNDYELAILFVLVWPLAIPITLVALVIKYIYKIIYYVVDKIYTKIESKIRKHKVKK